MSTALRRTKRHPPPPPNPKVIRFHCTRRIRRKLTKPAANHHHHTNPLLLMRQKHQCHRGKLENLFDQEKIDSPTTHGIHMEFSNPNSNSNSSAVERRERVEENGRGEYFNGGDFGFEEEKWRFHAEILRAECKILRMEREFALKKLQKNRVKMERTLKSAVQTIVSGRKKIFEGKNVNAVLEEEIEYLAEKLEELQKSTRINKDSQVLNCSNFDTTACLLRQRLENLEGLSNGNSVKDLREVAESSLCINVNRTDIDKMNKSTDNVQVEMRRKKIEGLSKGILNRVEEECNSFPPITANSSVASSASTPKRIDRPELSSFSTRQLYQEPVMPHENICSGRCKAIVGRIVEQVRAETEQWSQMQEMLAQVRGEMEELHASRDFWENRAFNADRQIQSLRQDVEEWKEKALGYESKVNELQLELSIHKDEIHKLKSELLPPVVPLQKKLEKEKLVSGSRSKKNRHIDIGGYKEFENALKELNIEEEERTPKEDLPPLSLGKQLAKEKRMLLRRLKGNRHDGIEKGSIHELSADGRRKISYSTGVGILDPKRSPLMDIGNSSPLTRQSSRSAFGFYSPENSRIKDSFKKMISLH